MNPDRLTIIIPTLDRTDHLRKSLYFATHQFDLRGEPYSARILIADQGETPETAALVQEYLEAGYTNIDHRHTHATSLWSNWRTGMEMAMNDGAEFVSWLQDDDRIHRSFAFRVCRSFDEFEDANTWAARLECADNEEISIWFSSNGPLIPMNGLDKIAVAVQGSLIAPYSYLTSFAMSPAVAFRAGRHLQDALDEQPRDCDLFTERTILTSMGRRADIVCDPLVAGYWVHHTKNECYKQRPDQAAQLARFIDWLDGQMDTLEGWEEPFGSWCQTIPNTFLQAFGANLSEDSRYCYRIAEIMKQNMGDANPPPMGQQDVGDGVGVGTVGTLNRKVPALVV